VQLPQADLKEANERSEYKELRKWSQDPQLWGEVLSGVRHATPPAQRKSLTRGEWLLLATRVQVTKCYMASMKEIIWLQHPLLAV